MRPFYRRMRAKERSLPAVSELQQLYSYDPSTGLITRLGRKPHTYKPPKNPHVYHSVFLRSKGGAKLSVKAHRLAWALHTGHWPKDVIDHINRDKHDNRFCNLRDVPLHVNAQNKPSIGIYRAGFIWKYLEGRTGKTTYGNFCKCLKARNAKRRDLLTLQKARATRGLASA